MANEGSSSARPLHPTASDSGRPGVWLDEIRVTDGVAVKWPTMGVIVLLVTTSLIFWRSATIEWMSTPGWVSTRQLTVPGKRYLAMTLAVPPEALHCFAAGSKVAVDHAGTLSGGPLAMQVETVASAPMDAAARQSTGVASGAAAFAVALGNEVETMAAQSLFGQAMHNEAAARLNIHIGMRHTAAGLLWPALARWMPVRCDLSL